MRFGIYIYVDGSDLHDVADLLLRRLSEIAREFPHVRVIDDRFEKTPDMHPDDLPDWNLGVNFDLDHVSIGHVPRLLESIRSLAPNFDRPDPAISLTDTTLVYLEHLTVPVHNLGGIKRDVALCMALHHSGLRMVFKNIGNSWKLHALVTPPSPSREVQCCIMSRVPVAFTVAFTDCCSRPGVSGGGR